MAIIYSYTLTAPKPKDIILGTVTLDENSTVPVYGNPTVNFSVQSVIDLVATGIGAQSLQQVTNVGATTSNVTIFESDIKVDGRFFDSAGQVGTTGQVLSSTVVGTSWTNPGAAGVTTVTTTDGTFINLTPNTAVGGAVTVTADLSATGTASATTFLRGDNKWETPPSAYTLPLAANGTRGGVQIGYTLNGKNYPLQLTSEKAFVNVPWSDTAYTLPAATDAALGGIKIGYTDNAKNYAVELDGDSEAFVNVPWTDTVYTLPLAADGTRGGAQIGYTTDGVARNYAITLAAEKMLVNVPWTDTTYSLPVATAAALGGVEIGYTQTATRDYPVVLDSDKMLVNIPWVNTWVANAVTIAGYVAAPAASDANLVWKTNGSGVPAWRADATIPDTGAVSISTIVNTTGTWTVPLESGTIDGSRNIQLTSNVYGGGAKVGYVPTAGTASTFLRGDGTWGAIPTGLTFKGTWSAAGTGGGSPDLTALSPADGWLYIVNVAGSAAPNGAGQTPNSWALGDWCIYNGTAWTRVPATNAGVTSVTTTDGAYINLTPNAATTGAITVTADLSAVDGTSDTGTRFLSKDNTWDIPSYTTDEDTTYTIDVPTSTTSINLKGIDGTNDAIALTGGTNVTLSRTNASTIDIAATNTNTQNEYATSWVDSSNDVLLRLTESGAGSGTQDIKIIAGTNITLTPSGTNLTITATDTNTTYLAMTSAVLGLGKLFSDTAQAVAATAVSATASRTYGLQMNSSNQLVVNVPWSSGGSYTLPAATVANLGGVRIFNATVNDTAPEANTTVANRNYSVALSTANKMLVNIPWTDTTYSLPLATSAVRGGVKIGYTETGKNYPVELSSEQMYVNVPWTDTDVRGVTSVTAGAGLKATASNPITSTGTILVDYGPGTGNIITLSPASASPAVIDVAADYFIYSDTSDTKTVKHALIGDLPFASSSASGTVTSVTGGNGITVSASTVTPAVSIDYTTGSDNIISSALVSAITVPVADQILILKSSGSAVGTVERTLVSKLPFTTNTGTVTSVGFTHAGNAFTVGGVPITGSGTAAVTMAGTSAQYIDGAGNLTTFPSIPSDPSGVYLPLAGGDMSGAIGTSSGNLQVDPATAVLEVRGVGSIDGGIRLNCYVNSHGQTLKAQPHSAGVTNTMLLPKGANSTLVSEVSASPFTNKSGSNNQWTNDAGYTTNTGTVTGTGTANYVSKWSSGTAQANSVLRDDGTGVAIGNAPDSTYRMLVDDLFCYKAGITGTGGGYFSKFVSGAGNPFHFRGTNVSNVIVFNVDNAGTLEVTGDVIAFGSPSDKRLKENIKPIESALDKVKKLQGVTFDWKEKDNKILDIKEDIGFIAQDVKEVLPELVRENQDGMLSMRHQGIAPILVEAIKELKAEIEELKNKPCKCNCK